jgi:hypothetical protein
MQRMRTDLLTEFIRATELMPRSKKAYDVI